MSRRVTALLGAALLGLAAVPAPASTLTLRGGITAGIRALDDAGMRTAYGQVYVFCPFLEIGLASGWTAGIAYEAAASQTGTLGLYEAAARFRMTGLEVTAGYERGFGPFAAYARAGYGLYHYEQTVDDDFARDYPIDHNASTIVIAGGIKFSPWRFLFLSAGAKYVPLKVKPYDVSVNLGGWRLLAGIGLAFGL